MARVGTTAANANLMTCLTTAMVGLFCSVLFRKTSIALMTTYLIIVVMFCVPLAANLFARSFAHLEDRWVEEAAISSPFAAVFAVPMQLDNLQVTSAANWGMFFGHMAFAGFLNLGLLASMIWLLNTRWMVAQ